MKTQLLNAELVGRLINLPHLVNFDKLSLDKSILCYEREYDCMSSCSSSCTGSCTGHCSGSCSGSCHGGCVGLADSQW